MAESLSLQDLVALNDEIAGLARSGVPLELGLTSWGRDLSGPLARHVERLQASLAAGKTLPQALDEHGGQMPPAYRAVVAAGLKSGRLSAALESLSRTARRLAEVRASVGLSVIYPLVVLLLGYFLVALVLVVAVPNLVLLYDNHPSAYLAHAAELGRFVASTVAIPYTDRVLPILFVPPLVVVFVAFLWWWQTRQALVLDSGPGGRWLNYLPVAGRVARNARAASLAEIFGLLVEHDVPLHEAVRLAADCTADRRLVREANELARAIEGGANGVENWRGLDGFPPLLSLLVASGARQASIAAMARHLADTYRRQVQRDADWLRSYLPMWLVLIVGGGIALVYVSMFFVPYTQLLQSLGQPLNSSMQLR